jgi:Parvulin-like peptidyl-prolyl isomerase
MKHIFLTLLFSLTAILPTLSQSNIIDGVAWIVGDEAILKSEVEEQRLRAQYERTPIEGDPYCVIPEQIALNKLFLHQAAIDSITADESMVTSNVDNQLDYYISRIGSKEKVEEYFGKKTIDLREELRTTMREQQMIQRMQMKLVENIKSTPADVRRFFNSLSADSVPTVPAQVELQIISFEPPVPAEEINSVKERLRDYSDRITSGRTDFAVLASMYSEDKGSAMRGGELGFMGRGQLVPEFSNVAFNLTDPTKVSRIVETEFGFHIIQLIERRGDRINCRHILLKPRISQTDKATAINKLDSITNLIRYEKMTFEQAVLYFSHDKNTVMNSGLMFNEESQTSKYEYQDLPAEVAKVAHTLKVGEISSPFSMIDTKTNKEVVAVIKIKSKTENHKANLLDDYQMLKSYYENIKREELIKNWILQKQKTTYVSIDPEWQNCKFQYPGWVK